MKFLDKNDLKLVSLLEKDMKNKFRWDWLSRIDCSGVEIGKWCKKIDLPGECFCIWCNKSIRYQNYGLKALTSHSASSQHKQSEISVKGTLNLFSYHSADSVENNSIVDINTRKARTETILCSFLAEHSLPFSLGPKLIELSNILSRDPKALQSSKISRTTVSYKMKYGLAKTIKDKLMQTLRITPFSLNIDESTSRAHESILSILVQYFSAEQNQIVTEHLASFELSVCSAKNIYDQVANLMEENSIPWENLISILLDSCNTMRGVKAGVETLIRKNKAPHLLTIDGDTCHTVNNCAKKFTEPFRKYVETFCDTLHFDLKSIHQRKLFLMICEILNINKLVPISRPDHRWLYVLPAIDRIIMLWDALIVHYFSWMKPQDKDIYRSNLEDIFKNRHLDQDSISKLSQINEVLKSKTLTEKGAERKQRIIKKLFVYQKKTLLEMNMYQDILPLFNEYVKLFQEKKPLIHELHVQMYNLIKQFLSFFLKHELISQCKTYKDISELDLKNESNHLSERMLFVGGQTSKLIGNKSSDKTVSNFKSVLKKAYILCATYMLQKLPFRNSILISFSCLDPLLRGETTTLRGLLKLANFTSSVLQSDEKILLDGEIRRYQIDSKIKNSYIYIEKIDEMGKNVKTQKRIDDYWADIFALTTPAGLKVYPILTKLVKALLTCFHGPVVESSFSFMESIITNHRTSLDVESLDAIQTIKYYLMSKKHTTFDEFASENPETDPIEKNLLKNMLNSWNEYKLNLQEKKSSDRKRKYNASVLQVENVVFTSNSKSAEGSSKDDGSKRIKAELLQHDSKYKEIKKSYSPESKKSEEFPKKNPNFKTSSFQDSISSNTMIDLSLESDNTNKMETNITQTMAKNKENKNVQKKQTTMKTFFSLAKAKN